MRVHNLTNYSKRSRFDGGDEVAPSRDPEDEAAVHNHNGRAQGT